MRFLPLSENNRKDMLDKIGVKSVDDLYIDVPKAARLDGLVDLPKHASEMQVERHFNKLAGMNTQAGSVPCFVGGGAYRHHVPAIVDHLIQRGEFLTSYTPYQPEITQGTLQYLFEFQTQVANLTGMDVANASLYDGSTGCGEAVLMARRVTRKKKAILSGNLHGQYQDTVKTLTRFTDDEVQILPANPANPDADIDALKAAVDADTSCVVVQNPNFFGHLVDLSELADICHANKALLVVVVTEIISLGAVKSPGAMGADIVVGEGQSIGNGLNFGGPYLGLFATNQKYVRQMPGRLCGETVDANGERGYVLTLSTREQHIRREKATSNICTNSGLCSLAFTVHLSLLGQVGLKKLAMLNHKKALQLKTKLEAAGLKVLNKAFFNEFTVELSSDANDVVNKLADQDILAGIPVSRIYNQDATLKNLLVMAVTETVSDDDIDAVVAALKGDA